MSGSLETSGPIGQGGVGVAKSPGIEVHVPFRAASNSQQTTYLKLNSKADGEGAAHHHLNVKYDVHRPTNAKELHVGSRVWIQVLQILPTWKRTPTAFSKY